MSTEPHDDGRDLRRQADEIALDDHVATSARPAHRIIATHLWAMLRGLGFDHGRVLAVGEDAATLLGLPHTDGHSFISLAADITPDHAPGAELPARETVPRAGDRYDVVIASLPYNDVRLQDPAHVVLRRAGQARLALALQRLTRPGGYTVLLASHDLMDNPYPEARRQLHLGGDLLGAVRLPAGAHRQLPGLDLTTDLLVLQRRRENVASRSQGFERTQSIRADGRDVEINAYFDNHVDQVLGTVGADPLAWGPAAITVTSTPDRLDRDLADALGSITSHGQRAGLTFGSADVLDPVRPTESSTADVVHERDDRPGARKPRPHHSHTHGHTGLER
ncbi:hypothetical protein ACFQ8T_04220 [Isoptericola sp. NPDC056618]|uniref:hypothetical protein n=1 Tax=Isoptericola sp. NPDC056618 TaxID=3345878 RepID=UPI0036AF8298